MKILEEAIKRYKNHSECIHQTLITKEEALNVYEWLNALKEIWDSGDCNDCRNRGCLYKPKLGQLVRYNCPFYSKEVNADADSD